MNARTSLTAPKVGERVLVIKAKGGFGNRILSAATGVVLAELTGRVPVIDWREGMYLPAGTNLYPLLFDNPNRIEPEKYDAAAQAEPPIWSGRLRDQPIDLIREKFPNSHSSPFVYRKLSLDLARPKSETQVAVFWSYLPKFGRLRPLMRRDPRYARRPIDTIVREVLDRWFRPNARVCGAVDALFEGRPRPVIGVHIRYTDRKAPLERIEQELDVLRRRLPDAAIFVATDNAQVELRIKARHADVFTIEKEMAAPGAALHFSTGFADPLREAENALIDLWALARCDWLIHSRHSTFSVAAALIGAIPPARQIDVDSRNPKVVLKRWFQGYA